MKFHQVKCYSLQNLPLHAPEIFFIIWAEHVRTLKQVSNLNITLGIRTLAQLTAHSLDTSVDVRDSKVSE